ncbi:MAG TPA: hypothetical protein VIW68_10400 [Candidatus Sulfotelmatobacter sp.]
MKAALFALLGLNTLLMAQSATIEKTGKSPVETAFAPGGEVRMDLCPAAVEIIGKKEGALRVSYDSGHGYGEDVHVRIQVMGNQADLRVTECPHNNFELNIEVPQASGLRVRMFAGQMEVTGITGNKDVQMHAGQLTLQIGDPADIGHVDASVTTGDLEAPPFEVSKSGLFRSFQKSGAGKYWVHAHVGAGQLELR